MSFEDDLKEYLKNKKVINLREIDCGDFKLTGYKSPYFDYEILLPYHYIMNYGGKDGVRYFKSRTEINNYSIKVKSFTGYIFITRIGNPVYINPNLNIESCDKDKMLDFYKFLVANSALMTIYFENKRIKNISVDYLINEYESKRIWLISDKYPTKDFLLRKEY